MSPTRPAGRLASVEVAGVVGLPDLELDLGPMTALVGPRGSGKSQLLSAIAWLLTGRHRVIAEGEGSAAAVSGRFDLDGHTASITRRPGARLAVGPHGSRPPPLPPCSYLRARDRFAPPRGSGGSVAARLATFGGQATSDAAAAEELVSVIQACCEESLTGELLLIEEPELLLTPQAQCYLYRLLRRFADGGNQVLYPTRSPAFVDAAHHDEIIRLDLRRGRRSVSRTSPDALNDAERVRLAAEFDVIQKSLREGFGLVVSEAMWKGTPVVAGRAGGIPLQMADGVGGHLVDDVESCGAAIVRLLREPAAARRLGRAGRERVRQ